MLVAGCRSGSDHGKSVEPTCVRRAPSLRAALAPARRRWHWAISPNAIGLQSVTICLHCGWTIATCCNLVKLL